MHHARATLREQGYRLTPQRNLIWEVLRDAGRHMTAEEVAAEVRRTLPDVNVSTVYRTLELLVSLDLVVETRLEGSAATTRSRRSPRTTTSSARSAAPWATSATSCWPPSTRNWASGTTSP